MARNENDIWIKINDIIYDTAKSNVSFRYYTKDDRISNFRIMSHFSLTDNSGKEWMDECSYGQCCYHPATFAEWIEIADCIKEKDWTYTKAVSGGREECLLDAATKEKLLQHMMNAKKELSKFLSLILRHKPEVIGITLDEHGWAKISELREKLRGRHTINIREQMIEEIVVTDEKQRYSFNEDKTLIRANQGHSIPVDVELEQVAPPEVLWHGTGEKYRESIAEKGLISKSRLYVHLSADKDTAVTVGKRHGKTIVYKVLTKEMESDGYVFYKSVNGVWLTKEVPVKYLQECFD